MRELAAAAVLAAAMTACGNSGPETAAGLVAVPGGGEPAPDGGSAQGSPPADGDPVDSADGGVANGGDDPWTDGGTASHPPSYSVVDLGRAVPNFIDVHGTVGGTVCDATSCGGATFTISGGWVAAPVPSGARSVVVMGIDVAGRLAMNAEFP